ncbi:MAG: type II secretion system GspH family protein [Heliobacteriaceae bacterium]|jgi:prepilin-type N-terminal cleavage/methylation domain-containing protein|nr:type II secretion system GspH family protein [Heliobacteriaceae bacterium]
MKKAFTLAEVLITLGIIGVVAALTIPPLINTYEEAALKSQFKKAYSLMQNSLNKAKADMDGFDPACGYWEANPYGSATCVSWDANGNCTRHQLANGDPLPSNYNGNFSDCAQIAAQMIKNFKVTKYCPNNAYTGGCIPAYKGNDTVKKEQNDSLSDYDVNKATSGCGGYRESVIRNSSQAYVLADKTIILAYSTTFTPQIFAIDINGKKPPNKWGYDLFSFSTTGQPKKMYLKAGGCDFTEKGGLTASAMLDKVNK